MKDKSLVESSKARIAELQMLDAHIKAKHNIPDDDRIMSKAETISFLNEAMGMGERRPAPVKLSVWQKVRRFFGWLED